MAGLRKHTAEIETEKARERNEKACVSVEGEADVCFSPFHRLLKCSVAHTNTLPLSCSLHSHHVGEHTDKESEREIQEGGGKDRRALQTDDNAFM